MKKSMRPKKKADKVIPHLKHDIKESQTSIHEDKELMKKLKGKKK